MSSIRISIIAPRVTWPSKVFISSTIGSMTELGIRWAVLSAAPSIQVNIPCLYLISAISRESRYQPNVERLRVLAADFSPVDVKFKTFRTRRIDDDLGCVVSSDVAAQHHHRHPKCLRIFGTIFLIAHHIGHVQIDQGDP